MYSFVLFLIENDFICVMIVVYDEIYIFVIIVLNCICIFLLGFIEGNVNNGFCIGKKLMFREI